MQTSKINIKMSKLLRRFLAVFITAAIAASSTAAGTATASFYTTAGYTTVGADGRSLDVYSGFTVNDNYLAPLGSNCREGLLLHDFAGVTIHETSNWSYGATAKMHAQYLQGSGQNSFVSWHYAVDSTSAYQSVPEYERSWHAGDGGNGEGNAQTISIEICDYTSDNNFDQAMANAEYLAADILYRHGVYTTNGYLWQHHDWNGKNCPITIRESGRWAEFCSKTQGFLNKMVAEKGTYTPILNTPTATLNQAKNWAAANGATEEFISLADIYWELAPKSGVDPTVAYAQSAHETGFGNFGGVIDATYYNPCGMKTTAGGDNYDPSAHQRFSSWREGIQAHIDHLALYAGQTGYPKSTTPDPRHFSFLFGTAPGVENLSGKWAPSSTYGATLVSYMDEIKATSKLPYDAVISNINVVSIVDGIMTVTVTVRNSGYTTWTAENNFRLGVSGSITENRVLLNPGESVAPGATHIFTYSCPVPSTDEIVFTAQMLQEGLYWFGEKKTLTIKPLNAEIVSVNMPSDTLAGQTYQVTVTVKNTGLTTWTAADNIRLSVGGTIAENRVQLAADQAVATGETCTFTYPVTAPASGTLRFTAQMIQEGVCRFGALSTTNMTVKVPSSADITDVTLSDGITAGGTFTANVTVKNTDTITWTAADNIRLSVSGSIAESRVLLPAGTSVAPGESYTFVYTGKVPFSGNFVFTAQMIQENVCRFGNASTTTIPIRDAEIVSTNAPSVLLDGHTQQVTVTVRNTGLATWTAADNYRLSVTGSFAEGRALLAAGESVAPGGTCTFTYPVKAPVTGSVIFKAQMIQENVCRFGSLSSVTMNTKIPSNAEITSVVLSDGIKAGGAFTASVTVKNTDTVTWTAADNIRLSVSGTIAEGRVLLPAGTSVAPGESYTFAYTGKVPSSGNLVFTAQMIQENVCRFGAATTTTIKALDAEIVSIDTPAVLMAGQNQQLTVTVKNTGLTVWTAADNYRLCVSGTIAEDRVLLASGQTVAPGETCTFTYSVKTAAPGTLTFAAQMIQENVCRFGAVSSRNITVKTPSAAEITDIKLSDGIKAGGTFTAEVTVKNTDTVTWTAADNIRLSVSGTIPENRVLLKPGETVAPGGSYTFVYTGTAPSSGNLVFTAQMIQENVCRFGTSATSTVYSQNAEIISTEAASGLTAGQIVPVTITVRNTGLATWTAADNYRLSVSGTIPEDRAFLAADQTVAPGETCTFIYNVTVPSPGTLVFTAQMMQELICRFGEAESTTLA